MSLTLHKDLPDATLRLEGAFRFEGHSAFRSVADELLAAEARRDLVLDLSAVSSMDSASLGMLLILKEKAEDKGRRVVLRNPSPAIRSLLDIVRFERLFDIQDTPMTSLDGIPGLDVEAGLKTVGGRRESLVHLLRRYEELHSGDGRLLREGLAAGDREGARRLAHSLKGAAGFLGLTAIQALAGQLEADLGAASPSGQTEGLLAAFEHENGATCASIRELLQAP